MLFANGLVKTLRKSQSQKGAFIPLYNIFHETIESSKAWKKAILVALARLLLYSYFLPRYRHVENGTDNKEGSRT